MTQKAPTMATVYLLLTLMLCSVSLSWQQQQPPPPSPAELQALLFLHDLMQANPDLKNLIAYAEKLPANSSTGPLQGVTLSPFLSLPLAFLKSMTTSPGNATGQTNASIATPATNATAPQNVDMAALVQQLMKNPVYSGLISEILGEVQSGLQQASKDNVDVTSNITALFRYIDPVSILRKAAVPLLAAAQFPDQTDLVNPDCYRDVIDSLQALADGQGWAIQMLDAIGKPGSGIMKGAFYFLGSYDQCANIKPHIERKGPLVGTTRDFETRNCRVDIGIPSSLTDALNVDTHGIHLKLIWGLCVPSSCHAPDVKGLFKLGVLQQANLDIENVECQRDRDLGSDKTAIAAIVVFAFFGLLVFCGTLIDGCRACARSDDEAECEAPHSKTTARSTHQHSNKNGHSLPPKQDHTNGLTFPVSKLEATNGVTLVNVQTKQADGAVNGDVVKESAPITEDEIKVDLPRGYVPHREGPLPPRYTSKPVTTLPVTSQGNDVNKAEHERPRANTPAKKDPVFIQALLCFSVYTNIPKILQARKSPGAISCVHGIRLISLTWVILGHTYNYGIISNGGTFTANNLLDFEAILQRFSYQAVMAGGYAVDTFFLLSAFLLTWIQMKEADKRKRKLDVPTAVMYYFHRFWRLWKDLSLSLLHAYIQGLISYFHRVWTYFYRLTPIYMIVILGYVGFYKYLGSGPFWPHDLNDAENCREAWWTNLLYVNNLVKTDTQCIGWSWYLANDMQFYVISPIFIAAMYIAVIPGVVLSTMLLVMGVAIAFWKEHLYNGSFLTMESDGGEYWHNVYTVPWCRVAPWAVGFLLGLLIHKRGRTPLRNKKYYALGWLLSTGMALFLVYITYTKNKKDGEPWTNTENALHESFGRPLWAACVGWVIFACHTGKGGVVNSFLSWNGLIPLSRLTYAAYLVHPICMKIYMFSRRNLYHAHDYNMIYLFLGHCCITFMVAFVFSLAFEAPFMALEKVLIPQPKRK